MTKPFDKNELLARLLVGWRAMGSHAELAKRVKELEAGDCRE